MIPPVTTDSVFRVPGIQATTAGTATTGTATVSSRQSPWQRGSSLQPVWQQRTVSQFPPPAVCIPQFPAWSPDLTSSSSTNEVERSKSEIVELKGYKEGLESYLELARSKTQELEEWNETLKSENDFVQAFNESSEARAIIQDLEEKLKEKNCVLEKSQANAKNVIEELAKHTDEFDKAINDLDDLRKENKKLNAKHKMFQGEIKEIRNTNKRLEENNKKLQDENSSIKCQLELSKSEASEEKKKIKKLEEELEEKNKMNQELSDKIQELNDKIKNEYAEQQRLIKPLEEKILASIEEANETEKIKSELSTSNYRLQKLKNSIASVTGCSTNSSYEDLMDSMAALKRKLDAPEAHSTTLSAQYQEVNNPKKKICVIDLEGEAN